MGSFEFWKQFEQITSVRIEELKDIVANKTMTGMTLRWTQGVLEANIQWNNRSKYEMNNYEYFRRYVAERETLRRNTFQANADED